MADVFDQNTNTNTSVAPANPDPFNDKLKLIVGDDGQPKYGTTDKALDALVHSQAHIKQLEAEKAAEKAELARLREVETQAKTLDEIVQRLTQNNNSQTEKTSQETGMSEAATVKALEELLNKRDKEAVAKQNIHNVSAALLSKFGDKVGDALATRAKELGTTVDELRSLSSRNPGMVLALFDVKNTSTQTTPPTSFSLQVQPVADVPLEPPKKSLLLGSTAKEQEAYMKKIKEKVYKEMGVET